MRGVCAHFLAWQSTKLVRVIKTLWAQTFFSTPLGWGCGIKKTYPLARLGGASIDSGKRFGGKRFCCELPAGPGPGAARRAREAKRSVHRCGRNAPSPPCSQAAPHCERGVVYLPCLRVGRRATADSAIPTRPTPCPRKVPRISAVGARCGSAQASGVAGLVARLVVNSHQRKGLGAAF